MNRVLGPVTAVVLAFAGAVQAQGQTTHHTVSGVLQQVDAAANKIIVKTADGVTHAVEVSGDAIAHAMGKAEQGVQAALRATSEGASKGAHVVIHVAEEGTRKTTSAVKVTGDRALEAAQVTIVKVDRTLHTVTVRTAEGAEQTLQLAKDGVLTAANATQNAGKATIHAVENAAREVEEELKAGTTWVIHYTTEGTDKVIQGLHQVR